MGSIYPNSYDMLNITGVLPYDVNEMVTGSSSEYFKTHHRTMTLDSPKDKFTKKNKKLNIDWKKFTLGAVGAYILGIVLSKGKTNPAKAYAAVVKSTGKIIKNTPKAIAWLVKGIGKTGIAIGKGLKQFVVAIFK